MNDTLERLYATLGYRFQDPEILLEALTHRSFFNECPDLGLKHNERLEFLGDAVVELAVSHALMLRLPEVREGRLTKLRAAVVSEPSLAACAAQLELGQHLRLGRGEDHSGGRTKASILSDAFEALMGAVYLDGGFEAAERTVATLLSDLLLAAVDGDLDRDHKTRLQEAAQQHHKCMPRYRVVGESGPDHAKRFTVAVFVGQQEIARGEGPSKKEAEQRAARNALQEVDADGG